MGNTEIMNFNKELIDKYEEVLDGVGLERGTYHLVHMYDNYDIDSVIYSDIFIQVFKVDKYIVIDWVCKTRVNSYLVVNNNEDYKKYYKSFINLSDDVHIRVRKYSARTSDWETIRKINTNKYTITYNDKFNRWCKRMDIYKKIEDVSTLNVLLHGPPGVGKTSFVEQIGVHLKHDLYILNSKNMDCIQEIGQKSIVIIEEIDKLLMPNGSFDSEFIKDPDTILQVLDGMMRPRKCIIFITCNDLERVKRNEALSRCGRIDFTEEFGFITREDCVSAVARYYPDADPDSLWNKVKGNNMTIAELAGVLKTSLLNEVDYTDIVVTSSKARHDTVMYY